MGIRFVTPERCRLPLSGDDYIVIKKRLSHGEMEEMLGRMMPHVTPGEKMQVDSRGVRTGKVLAYLVGWSSSEPIDADTIANLDPDTFAEIESAIDVHLEHEAAAVKNVLATASVRT